MKTKYNTKIQDLQFSKIYSEQVNQHFDILIAKGTQRKNEK